MTSDNTLQEREAYKHEWGAYGLCPVCTARGVMRERRPNGNDKCARGHEYPSANAITGKAARAQPAPAAGVVEALKLAYNLLIKANLRDGARENQRCGRCDYCEKLLSNADDDDCGECYPIVKAIAAIPAPSVGKDELMQIIYDALPESIDVDVPYCTQAERFTQLVAASLIASGVINVQEDKNHD